MDKLQSSHNVEKGDTLLERAIRRELKRIDRVQAICSSHRTAGTVALPQPAYRVQRQIQ